ncbi:MAG: response regulator [Bdellovibrionaceae bacterium]|nr:response regulator [Streptococcus sp.]MCB9073588.1 response regulator [Pseudobdellovibrionaceae bacterium]
MSAKKRFLLIDDSKSIHAFVREAVSPLGFEMVSVFDGAQGVAKIQADKNFDFILLDWEMPVMDGPTTLKELVKMVPHIPISMITSKNSFENLKEMITIGAKEYIMKPFTKDIFLEKIQTLCPVETKVS